MFNIYTVTLLQSDKLEKIWHIIIMGTLSSIGELIISSFICGSVHEKSNKIFAVLDEFSSNDLSESEYKDWLMFANISRKTKFGFTFGGFACIRKTTLISVGVCNYANNLF